MTKYNDKGEEVIMYSTTAVGAAVDFSAGTSSANLSSLVFADSNGVSFGLSGSTITASAAGGTGGAGPAISAGTQLASTGTVIFSNSGGVTFGLSNSSVLTAAISAIKGLGASNTGNTSGNTGISTGIDWVFAGTQNITVSQSTAVGGPNTLWVSGPVVGGLQTGISGIEVSNTTYTSGTVTFRNANGISFGSSGANGISASYTVPTQSNQTIGAYAVSNTTGQSSSSTFDARTVSLHGGGIVSVGYSGGSVVISAPTNFLTTAALSNHSHGNPQLNLTNLSGTTASNSAGFTLSLSAGLPEVPFGISAGTQSVSTGTLVFSNSNGITFGMSGSSRITASHVINVSAGTTSNNLSALTFSNGSGVSFGLNASTITAGISAIKALGASNTGNTAGNTGVSTGVDWVFAGTNNVTVSQSTAAGGPNTLWFSAAAGGGAVTGISGIQVSDTTYTSGTVTFRNANGISFGSSGAQGISASYTVPTQTVQTQNVHNVTLSGNSTSAGAGFIQISSGTWTLAGGNNITLSQNGNAVTISGAAAGGAQTAISGIEVSDTTYTSGTVTFRNANGISFGSSGAQGISASYTQSGQAFSADVSSTFSTLTFQDSNGVSFSNNAGALRVTHALQFTSATSAITSNALHSSASRVINILAATNTTGGGTASLSSNVSFSNANGATFYTSAGNAIALSYTVPTQSNQTLGLYAVSNTTGQSSSSTFDARTVSLHGAGIISIGYSGGSVVFSAPTNFLTTAALSNHSHGNPQLNLTNLSGTTASNSAGFTLSLSAAATVAQTNQTLGLYAVSNTTGQSSSSTFDARTLSFHGAGIASVGYSGGSVVISVPAGGGGGVAISAGTQSVSTGTVSFADSNGVTFGMSGSSQVTASIAQYSIVFQNSNNITFGTSTAGSTTSVTASHQPPYVSSYENLPHMGHEQTMTLNGVSVSHAVAFIMPVEGSFSFIRIPAVMTANQTTLSTLASTMNGSAQRYSTFNAVVYKMNTGASSRSLTWVASGSTGWTWLNSISVATNGTQGSYSQAFTCAAEGDSTTFSTQYSISNTNYSFASGTVATRFSGSRYLDINFSNSLSAGAYWLVFGYSSSSASNSARVSAATVNGVGYSNHYGISQANIAFGVLGSTDFTTCPLGAGSFSTAGGGTTVAFPLSAISSSASHVRPYFQMLRSA